jgi:hypothetical protein
MNHYDHAAEQVALTNIDALEAKHFHFKELEADITQAVENAQKAGFAFGENTLKGLLVDTINARWENEYAIEELRRQAAGQKAAREAVENREANAQEIGGRSDGQ